MKLKLLAAIFLSLFLTACAHKPGTGSIADSAVTYTILSKGGAELNPIIGWNGDPAITALTALGLKQGAKYAITPLVGHCQAHRYIETGGWFGGGWGIAALLEASTVMHPIGGIVAALIYFQVTSSNCAEIGE